MKKQYPADFSYNVINDVVVIYDLDSGNCCVTNDIENVLARIQEEIPNLGEKKVIYRDSDKIFDGVEVDKLGRFVRFYSLNKTTLEEALEKLNNLKSIRR